MKKIVNFIIVLSVVVNLIGCEYDNYDEPASVLQGRFVYNDMEVGVKNNLDVIRLYEDGWDNLTPINVSVNHNGTFKAKLFDGNYKFSLVLGNGPWTNIADTISFKLQGSKELDIAVEPFFWISDETYATSDNTLSASFNLEKVAANSELEYVGLFIGKTSLVDDQFNSKNVKLQATGIPDINETINLNIGVEDVTQGFLFARIGVKAKSSPQLIFTQVKKIEL